MARSSMERSLRFLDARGCGDPHQKQRLMILELFPNYKQGSKRQRSGTVRG